MVLWMWGPTLAVALRWQYWRRLLILHLLLSGRSYGGIARSWVLGAAIVLDMPGGMPVVGLLLVLRVVGHLE